MLEHYGTIQNITEQYTTYHCLLPPYLIYHGLTLADKYVIIVGRFDSSKFDIGGVSFETVQDVTQGSTQARVP